MFENAVFDVTAKPHPLRAELIQGVVPVGCTLAEMGAGDTTWAWVNGERSQNLMYAPAAGDKVVLAAVPAGNGGNKDGLFVIASLALAAASGGASAYITAQYGAVAGALAGAAVGIVGGLLLNAIIPPPDQNLNLGNTFQPFNAIQRTNNRISPFEPVPVLLGQHRVYPPYASQPVPVTNGGQQDFLGLFCVGQRNLNVDEGTFKLGETPLSNYAEAEYRIWDYTRDEDLGGLFPIGAVTDSNPGDLKTGSATVTRTSPTGTKRVEVEVGGGPIGWFGEEDGPVMAVPFIVEYRVAGSSDSFTMATLEVLAGDGGFSANFPEGVDQGQSTYPDDEGWEREDDDNQGPAAYVRGTAKDVRTYTLSVGFDLPATGQYEVKVSRLDARHPVGDGLFSYSWSTSSANGERGRQEINLIRLRYIRDAETAASTSYELDPAYSYVALKLKASDQLQGVVDDFNLVAQSVLPAWDGEDWVETATNNPAWCYRYVLTGERNGRPVAVSKVDDEVLKTWGATCDAETPPREFNGEFTARTTVFDALRSIASAGRAAFSVRNSKYSVVRDIAGLTPVQVFTPRNSWDFSGTKVFPRNPHALKVKFHDRDGGWAESERVVYDDGYSEDGAGDTEVATVFEQLALFGCTHKDQAYKDGRYNLAVGRLRPETFTWQCALENIVCTRGDVVRLQHDAILVGLGAGRIKALDETSITLDELLTVEDGKTYQARIRKDDGAQALVSITNSVGEHSVLTLSGGVPEGVKVGDLVALGESGAVTLDVLITGIDPDDDFNAAITAVPYSSPGVHDAETGTIPDYDPLVTPPQLTPPAPYVINVDSSAAIGGRTSSGDFLPRVFIQLAFPESPALITRVEAQYREADVGNWTPAFGGPNNGSALFDVDGSATLDLRVRGVSDTGIPGPWTEIHDYALETSHGAVDPTLSLVEQINNPATPNQDLSTVVVTVTPPVPEDPAYSHSLVEYRRATQLGWTVIGTTDQNEQARVVLPRNGLEYEFRARRVNTSGLISRFGETASITLSTATGAPPAGDPDSGAPTSATLDVENLRIYGELVAATEFTGPEAHVEWDAATAPSGETLRDYRVRVIETSTGNVLRVEYVVGANYLYDLATNTADSVLLGYAAPRRALTFEVIARTMQGTRSNTAASKDITNLAPTLPGDFAVSASENTIRLRFTPADADYARAEVFLSTTNGFTPGGGNKVYDGRETNPIELTGLAFNTTYYLVVRLYDEFGVGADSSQYTQVTGAAPAPGSGDTVAPAAATSFTATPALDKVLLEWSNPADADLKGLLIYRGTSSDFTADASSLIAGPMGGSVFVDADVVNGTDYYYKHQTIDFAGNTSAVSSVVGPAAPFKISGINIGDYIAQNALQAQYLSVGDWTNLVDNADFELGDIAWGSSGAGWTVENDPDEAWNGSWVAKRSAQASETHLEPVPKTVRCQEGDTFYATARLKVPNGTGGARVGVHFMRADATYISGVKGTAITSTSYVTSTAAATAPAGAMFAYIAVSVNPGGDCVVDNTQLFRVIGSALIADGAIISGKIAANAVTTNELRVGDFTNLLENADFQLGDIGWHHNTDGWTIEEDPTNARRGTFVLKQSPGGLKSTRNDFRTRCVEGDVFYASCYIKSPGASGGSGARIEFVFRTATLTQITNPVSAWVAPGTSAYTATALTATAPAGAVFCETRILTNYTSGPTYVADSALFRVAGSALIADAAIITAKIANLAVTSAKIQSLDVGKLTAGTMTAAIIQSSGHIAGGKSSYADSTAGYFLGFDSGTAKLKVGDASNGMDWNGTAMTVTGVIQTAASGQRVVMTSGNETEFYDDYGSLACSIGINNAGGNDTYMVVGVNGGNATQAGRTAIYAQSNGWDAVLAAGGNYGVKAFGFRGGVHGSTSDGIGATGVCTKTTSNILGASPEYTVQDVTAVGVFGDAVSVGVAGSGTYGVLGRQRSSNTSGGSLLLKSFSSITTAPSHSAEAGTFCVRYVLGVTRVYVQTAGGFGGSGSTWTQL